MKAKANSVAEYLEALPADRRETLSAIRKVILDNIDKKHFEEGMQYGMIGYYIPHSVYPPGYHCDPKEPLPYLGLGAQKNHLGIYLMGVYADPAMSAWFQKAWKATGRKLDMGKACVRVKKLEDVALDVLATLIRRQGHKEVIGAYESARAEHAQSKAHKGKDHASRERMTVSSKKTTALKSKAATQAKSTPKKKVAKVSKAGAKVQATADSRVVKKTASKKAARKS